MEVGQVSAEYRANGGGGTWIVASQMSRVRAVVLTHSLTSSCSHFLSLSLSLSEEAKLDQLQCVRIELQ